MRSIENTLSLVKELCDSLSKTTGVYIALAGGYGVIAHGVERTTADIDFCLYADIIRDRDTKAFVELLQEVLPDNFTITLVEGSKIVDDPFKHDIVFIEDNAGEYPRIDIIIARYKWELEGIKLAKPLEDMPFPVLPKPYLIAMKLKADSLKDNYDAIELYRSLTADEREKTHELAKLIHKDKKLLTLIKPRRPGKEKEDKKLLL